MLGRDGVQGNKYWKTRPEENNSRGAVSLGGMFVRLEGRGGGVLSGGIRGGVDALEKKAGDDRKLKKRGAHEEGKKVLKHCWATQFRKTGRATTSMEDGKSDPR